MKAVFKLSRIGRPEHTITKMVTSGARINALICLKASKPNKIKASNKTNMPKFITFGPPEGYIIYLQQRGGNESAPLGNIHVKFLFNLIIILQDP